MIPRTPKNVAALAMTLSFVMRIDDNDTIKGIYEVVKIVYDFVDSEPGAPKSDDLEDEVLKSFVSSAITEVSLCGKPQLTREQTTERSTNMYFYLCDALDQLKDNMETAHHMASVLLGKDYPGD